MASLDETVQCICITRRLPEAGPQRLESHNLRFNYHNSDTPLQDWMLATQVKGFTGIICQIGDRFDRTLLESISDQCKIIATVSVGYDHIDVVAARELGILVTHTPDVLTEATADLAWTLMLAAGRRAGEAERHLRSGQWHGWGMMQFLGVDFHKATLGIVGGGRIGAAVARRAAGFGMKVLCCTRRPEASPMPGHTEFVELDELLQRSDFVSLHMPLTPQTRHMIGADQLAMMKPTAVLVNTARGPVIDEAAMIAALREKRIFAAGLDVFEHEPRIPDELLALENVVALPHIGSATRPTRETMAVMCADAVAAAVRGKTPENVVWRNEKR